MTASPEHPSRIGVDELAARLGVDPSRIDELVDHGVIVRGEDGLFAGGDIHRVRLLSAFENSGVPMDALLAASRAGAISLTYYDQLHAPPERLSGRTYAEFAATLGVGGQHLSRLYAAFGLAEPEPDAPQTIEDEELVGELLAIVVATGQPDLALRTVRLFGEGSRRAADGALGIYGEAVERQGEDLAGLPADALFERLLEPWARFARTSAELAAWLTNHHLTRAVDEYSVTQTERILEEAGFVATRLDRPPAVAFVDLTGFTRLTQERGDEVAAATALRLGEVTTDVCTPHGGRLVKLLGDGVLLRFDDAAAAVRATLQLLDALPEAGLPTVHAGIAAGPLVVRDGDIFGRTVNLAARIADAAPDGRLYLPSELAATLDATGLRVRAVEPAQLAGIGLVDLADVERAD